MNNTTRLHAKVIARNRANRLAIEFYDKAIGAVSALVGQKVLKADGSLTEKLRKVLPPLAPGHYHSRSDYSLCFVIKECESVANGYGCEYQEACVYLGDITDGVLVKICPPATFRTDYSAAEILDARAEVAKAKEALRNAEAKLMNFGEWDSP